MTGSGASTTVTPMSATGRTEIIFVTVLLLVIESATADLTLLMFMAEPSALAVTSIASKTDAPALKLPRLQVTKLPLTVQPLFFRIVTTVILAGKQVVK